MTAGGMGTPDVMDSQHPAVTNYLRLGRAAVPG